MRCCEGKGTDKYLTCVEALGASRYFRADVADKLDGEWYPVEGFDTVDKPFAGKANRTFEEGVRPGPARSATVRSYAKETMNA